MKTICVLVGVACFAALALGSSAEGHLSDVWEWGFQGFGSQSLLAGSPELNVVVATFANKQGLSAYNVQTGSPKWLWYIPTTPSTKGATILELQVRGDSVLLAYGVRTNDPLNPLKSLTAVVLNKTGGVSYAYNFTEPLAAFTLSADRVVIYYAGLKQLVSFKFDGSADWTNTFTYTNPNGISVNSLTAGKDIVLVQLENGFEDLDIAYSLHTGEAVCLAKTGSPTRLVAGNDFVDHQTNWIVDGNAPETSKAAGPFGIPFCKNKTKFSETFGDQHVTRVSGENMFEFEKNGTTRCYKNGVAAWTTKLPNKGNFEGKVDQYGAVIEVAPDQGTYEGYALNVNGNMSFFNNTDGSILWAPNPKSNASFLPFRGKPLGGGVPQIAHRIGTGSKLYFVPNLQGWNILDIESGTVIDHNLRTPISNSFGYSTEAGYIVVFIDLESGFLKGVTWKNAK